MLKIDNSREERGRAVRQIEILADTGVQTTEEWSRLERHNAEQKTLQGRIEAIGLIRRPQLNAPAATRPQSAEEPFQRYIETDVSAWRGRR